ncbi:MAG TPA: ROK family protein [Verrucomicrobiae bacterium]|nr:ROK family protein [Verrucomicrobiae bacterium]
MIKTDDIYSDNRVVMTLDAGGINFRFSAMQRGSAVVKAIVTPAYGKDLVRCLGNMNECFEHVKSQCPAPPMAISFGICGPSHYTQGIIGDVAHLPCFRGGVALGSMLEDKFNIPVYINNDADLFVYGEAIAGLLPHINQQLAKAGNPKRYRNLFGLTIDTGLGAGIVRNGEMFLGDNSVAGEIWLMRNKLDTKMNAEEGACIRALRRVYAQQAGIPIQSAPDLQGIEEIALDEKSAYREAALEAYRRLGEVAGDALANALSLVDGLAVLGGEVSRGAHLFLPEIVNELNSNFTSPSGRKYKRLIPNVYNLEEPAHLEEFLRREVSELTVPGSLRRVRYDSSQRIGVGISRLGTSEAMAIGAYAFALEKLRVFA